MRGLALSVAFLASATASAATYISVGGVTLHASIDPEIATFMPTRIDEGGRMVVHPVAISLDDFGSKHAKGFTVLLDCFGKNAAGAYYGATFGNFAIGGAIYVRERFEADLGERHLSVDSGPTAFEFEATEVLITPMVAVVVPIGGKVSVVVKSNILLTHAGLAFDIL